MSRLDRARFIAEQLAAGEFVGADGLLTESPRLIISRLFPGLVDTQVDALVTYMRNQGYLSTAPGEGRQKVWRLLKDDKPSPGNEQSGLDAPLTAGQGELAEIVAALLRAADAREEEATREIRATRSVAAALAELLTLDEVPLVIQRLQELL